MLDYLPEEALTLQLGGRLNMPGGLPHADAARFSTLYSAPDFGWTFCRLLNDHDIRFPGGVCFGRDEVLLRTYLHLRDPRTFKAKDIQGALAIRHAMGTTRTTVEGLLLSAGSTVESVAKLCSMPTDVISAYERLFFNVLDRREDAVYLQQIVYPHGRLVELMDDYMTRENLGMLVRRAGYVNGADDVMFIMGASTNALDALQSVSSAQQYERLLMAFGFLLARNGAASQNRVAAVQNARQLLQAGKLGGDSTGDRPVGPGIAESLRAEMQAHCRPARRVIEANPTVVA